MLWLLNTRRQAPLSALCLGLDRVRDEDVEVAGRRSPWRRRQRNLQDGTRAPLPWATFRVAGRHLKRSGHHDGLAAMRTLQPRPDTCSKRSLFSFRPRNQPPTRRVSRLFLGCDAWRQGCSGADSRWIIFGRASVGKRARVEEDSEMTGATHTSQRHRTPAATWRRALTLLALDATADMRDLKNCRYAESLLRGQAVVECLGLCGEMRRGRKDGLGRGQAGEERGDRIARAIKTADAVARQTSYVRAAGWPSSPAGSPDSAKRAEKEQWRERLRAHKIFLEKSGERGWARMFARRG